MNDFPDTEKYKLNDMIREDLKKWILAVETYFENHTLAHIIFKVVLFLIGLAGIIIDTLQITDGFWTPLYTHVLLIIIIVLALTADFFHVLLAKRRHIDLIRSKRLVNNMVKVIRGATNLQIRNYKVVNWEVEHHIKDNGDVEYRRTMTIGYLVGRVYWVKVPIGVIDGEEEDKAKDLGIEVINPVDNGRLPWAIIEETNQKKVLAILLDPPVTSSNNSSLRLSLNWRGAYKPLISEMQDNGKFTVEHETEHLKIRFIAPKGLVFTAIRMIYELGSSNIDVLADGQSVLEWEADNLELGEYPYTLICKRKEP